MNTIVTILSILLLISYSGQLYACTCSGQRAVEEEVKQVDAVFVGTVLSKQIVSMSDTTMLQIFQNDSILRNSPTSKMMITRYNLLVQDIYKGNITQDTLTIFTGLGGGDCGINFEIGIKYIVYSKIDSYLGLFIKDFVFPLRNNTFWTYNCLRTTSYFQDEITEIEKYEKRKFINKEELIFSDPDNPPVFKDGGDIGLRKFIKENLRYPNTSECVTGTVCVSFIVDTLGNVKDIEIKKGLSTSINEEAIRIVKLLTFLPGTRYGQPLEMKLTLPIRFKIE